MRGVRLLNSVSRNTFGPVANQRGVGMFFLIMVIAFCTTYCFLPLVMFKMLLFFIHTKCLDFLTSNISLKTTFRIRQLNSSQLSQQPQEPTQEEFPSWTNTPPALKVQFVQEQFRVCLHYPASPSLSSCLHLAQTESFFSKAVSTKSKPFSHCFLFSPPFTWRYDPWFLQIGEECISPLNYRKSRPMCAVLPCMLDAKLENLTTKSI